MSRGDQPKAHGGAADPAGAAAVLDDQQIAVMVEDYLPLVVSQVDRVWLSAKIGLTRDDLVSAGCYGLLLAARRFDPRRGVGFGVFARAHVHGALMREINSAVKASGGGRDDDVLAPDGVVEPDSLPDEHAPDELELAASAEVRTLMECLLTTHERTLLSLYFFEELTLAELAAVVGGSESAAARAIKGALAKLKAALVNG